MTDVHISAEQIATVVDVLKETTENPWQGLCLLVCAIIEVDKTARDPEKRDVPLLTIISGILDCCSPDPIGHA